MTPLRTLFLLLSVSLLAPRASLLAANVYLYIGPTGQTLYGRVEETSGSFVAFALTEGTGGAKGKYYATEANIVAAGLDTASSGEGFIVTVHAGASPSTIAEDPIAASARLRWTGSAEETTSGAGSGSAVSAALVDDDDTWTFETSGQITSPKILAEGKSAAVLKACDFSEPATKWGSISTINSVTIVDVAGVSKPTITSSTLSLDRKKVNVLLNAAAATAATHTVVISITTTDSQVLIRKGRLKIE